MRLICQQYIQNLTKINDLRSDKHHLGGTRVVLSFGRGLSLCRGVSAEGLYFRTVPAVSKTKLEVITTGPTLFDILYGEGTAFGKQQKVWINE